MNYPNYIFSFIPKIYTKTNIYKELNFNYLTASYSLKRNTICIKNDILIFYSNFIDDFTEIIKIHRNSNIIAYIRDGLFPFITIENPIFILIALLDNNIQFNFKHFISWTLDKKHNSNYLYIYGIDSNLDKNCFMLNKASKTIHKIENIANIDHNIYKELDDAFDKLKKYNLIDTNKTNFSNINFINNKYVNYSSDEKSIHNSLELNCSSVSQESIKNILDNKLDNNVFKNKIEELEKESILEENSILIEKFKQFIYTIFYDNILSKFNQDKNINVLNNLILKYKNYESFVQDYNNNQAVVDLDNINEYRKIIYYDIYNKWITSVINKIRHISDNKNFFSENSIKDLKKLKLDNNADILNKLNLINEFKKIIYNFLYEGIIKLNTTFSNFFENFYIDFQNLFDNLGDYTCIYIYNYCKVLLKEKIQHCKIII